MTKRLLIAVIAIPLLMSSTLKIYSQISEFNLSDFKLPDFKRQGIDFSVNLSGEIYRNESKVDTFNQVESKSKNLSNSFTGNYFLFINTRKYQGSHNFGIWSNIYLSDNKSTGYDGNSKNYNYGTNISSINRFYSEKEFFISFGVNGDIEAAISKLENYYDSTIYANESYKIDYEYTKNRISLPIGIGKGRIEPVEDARHAVYILQELKKADRLKREPNHEEILEFAKRIAEIKNERVLDYRLKKIYELGQLDSVLIAMDLLETGDMVYFATLNDMWDYGGMPQRSSGFRVELQYSPEYEFNVERYVNYLPIYNENETNYNSFNSNFNMNLNWSKPIRQRLQSNLFVGITYFIQPDNGDNKNGISSAISYGFGIYPNTRTSLNFGVNLWGSKSWQTENENPVDAWQYRINPDISIYYYFSPKLSIKFSLYSAYQYNFDNYYMTDRERTNFYNNFNIRLVYSIF